MSEEQTLVFIRTNFGSVYALELFLMVRRFRDRSWDISELVRELRSSATAVNDGLDKLIRAGFVLENPPGHYRFAPASPELERLAAEIDVVYTNKPISVVKAIVCP